MKNGHQDITSLDTFFTFKDFIIPVILEVTGINLENISEQLKLLFFKILFWRKRYLKLQNVTLL